MRLRPVVAMSALVVGTCMAGIWALSWNVCHLGDRREEFVLLTMRGIHEAVTVSGNCPTLSEGLAKLVAGQHLSKLPIDPWWGDYEYKTDGITFTLTSFGEDGKHGGVGKAADIQLTFQCPSIELSGR